MVFAIVRFGERLRLQIVVDRKCGGMRRVVQSLLSLERLGLAVVELALLVDMQQSSRLIVLVALDVAGLSRPIVAGGFIGERGLDRCVVTQVGLGRNLDVVIRRILNAMLELPSLLFRGLFFFVLVMVCSSDWVVLRHLVLRSRLPRLC